MKSAIAHDNLRIHFTIIGKSYKILEEDEECYKIMDERGLTNWIPKRYMTLCEDEGEGHEKSQP